MKPSATALAVAASIVRNQSSMATHMGSMAVSTGGWTPWALRAALMYSSQKVEESSPEVDMVGRRSVMWCQPACGVSRYVRLPLGTSGGGSADFPTINRSGGY